MGFRNEHRRGRTFTVVAGPASLRAAHRSDEGGVAATGTLTGRGYLVVDIPAGATGTALNVDTVTDLAPEFKLAAGSPASVTLDNTQAPVLVDGKFWYWVNGAADVTGTISIVFLKETWSYTAADGQEAFAAGGAYQDANNAWQGEAASTVAVPVFMIPYIDVRLVPSTSGEIDDATLQSFAASGVTLLRKEQGGDRDLSRLAPAAGDTDRKASLGLGRRRFASSSIRRTPTASRRASTC
jgi:hypothetical protein